MALSTLLSKFGIINANVLVFENSTDHALS